MAFSFGGDPASIAAVGLRARRTRGAESESVWACDGRPLDERPTDEVRFNALRILSLSDLEACHDLGFSPSEELLPLSLGVLSLVISSTVCNEERLAALLRSIVRRGELSESDELRLAITGGGVPSDFLERKPAWKRLFFGRISADGSGAGGIGDESFESTVISEAR